jgi:hypothetical protein
MSQKILLFLFSAATLAAIGQDTFIYDQQSTNLVEGAAFLQSGQPMGQSFAPTLSSVGFVILNLYDSDGLHNLGSTVYVNLRSDSITGPILGSSTAVFLPDGFFGIANFIFSTPMDVTPGLTYYLQPLIQSGDTVGSYVTDGSYAGGMLISQGVPILDRDLWFREGIVVPEPSGAVLFLIGSGLLLYLRRSQNRQGPEV